MDFQDRVSSEKLRNNTSGSRKDYFAELIGGAVLCGGFANKTKNDEVNSAQEKIVNDKL